MIQLLRKLCRCFIGDVSVEDYGAKGDGITDDTDAIQRAIDACR